MNGGDSKNVVMKRILDSSEGPLSVDVSSLSPRSLIDSFEFFNHLES